jgi:putative toxin-antitoxin system antitoxin component (TIGR02293 family)
MATETAVPALSNIPALGSYELIRAVEEGLPTDSLEVLKQRGLTFTEIADLVIPPRTLKHRKARGERLTTEETERFFRVIRVLDLGEKIFGKRERLLSWLRGPDFEIPNRTSMSLLATEAGAQAIVGQLWAVAEGIYQ